MRGDEALLVRGYDPESTEPALRMYSQEYANALLAENMRVAHDLIARNGEIEGLKKRADELLAELEAKNKCIAEAEVRGVEKLAAAFKSWASDETFPDCEAQRHWATASQEALSFAGDLRNGSCDDR
nr:hypothetical protein [Serratia marcescens]